MGHAAEGSLQAYLDGELDGTAETELSRHLVACTTCAAELEALRSIHVRAGAALALLDVPAPPVFQARAAVARRQGSRSGTFLSLGGRSLAKAAMLLLALAGAGAAAIPGSPVRRAVEDTLARVAQWLGADQEAPVVQVEQPPFSDSDIEVRTDGAGVLPANGQVRFVLLAPAEPVDLVVTLSDSDVARVETAMEQSEVSFRTRAGLIQVSGLGRGTVRVMIPRTVPEATVELGGRVLVSKSGSLLRSAAPGSPTAEEVRLRIGS